MPICFLGWSLILLTQKEKILIVDDEASICQILQTRLTIKGYQIYTALNGEQALKIFKHEKPNLVILDIMLPGLDGYRVCHELRKNSNVPIIMLTALGNISDRVMGLEFGADDYIIKPFSPKELEARIRAILRRVIILPPPINKQKKSIVEISSLIIDFNKRNVHKKGHKIHLTGIEFNLLEILITKAGKRLPRTLILNSVWGYVPERHVDTRVVDVHISRLRAKLEDDPNNPQLILTARGTGYMFRSFSQIEPS
jgi:OmpR family response regulator RpaB